MPITCNEEPLTPCLAPRLRGCSGSAMTPRIGLVTTEHRQAVHREGTFFFSHCTCRRSGDTIIVRKRSRWATRFWYILLLRESQIRHNFANSFSSILSLFPIIILQETSQFFLCLLKLFLVLPSHLVLQTLSSLHISALLLEYL